MDSTQRWIAAIWITTVSSLSAATAGAQDASPTLFEGAAELDRSALVEEVLRRNPTVGAAREAWAAARAEVPQAGALPYPSVEYAVAPLSAAPEARFGQRVQAMQQVPFPGKLRLRASVAQAEADVSQADFEATRHEMALEASLLFDDWYVVHRALDINAEHQALLEDFKRIATAKFAAGQASMQDPLQAEVELAHLEHREIVLNTDRSVVRARINALLHRPAREELPPPPKALDVPDPVETEDPVEQALAARPESSAAEARIRAGTAALKLARRELLPDFALMASYDSMWMEPDHQTMVGVGLVLPIWPGKVRGLREEATASLRRARQLRAQVEDQIGQEVVTAQERLQQAHHVVDLYERRVVPAARDQVEAARSGFETGRNSFLALIEAERNLQSVELAQQTALADFQRRRAELARALGRMPASAKSENGESR